MMAVVRERGWDIGAPSWNVAPGTEQPLIYPDGSVRRAHWEYRPAWAEAKKLPPIMNAKSERLASTWKALARRGRVIVPRDHWYKGLPAADGRRRQAAVCHPTPRRRPAVDGWSVQRCGRGGVARGRIHTAERLRQRGVMRDQMPNAIEKIRQLHGGSQPT